MIDLETKNCIVQAIAEQGSVAYITPSGAILDLMTKLADEDNLEAFSYAFVTFARAMQTNPAVQLSNLICVAAEIPAKIANFMIKHRGVDPGVLLKWATKNQGWIEKLMNAIWDWAQFPRFVEDMVDEIKKMSQEK